MNEQQQIENLEIRVRRLEQLHLWGISAIFIIGVGYFLVKKKR